jgi:hypothetical protein
MSNRSIALVGAWTGVAGVILGAGQIGVDVVPLTQGPPQVIVTVMAQPQPTHRVWTLWYRVDWPGGPAWINGQYLSDPGADD